MVLLHSYRLPKELDVARLAIRVVAMLLEGTLVQQLEAEGTGEVLGVPLLAHGCDGFARDRLLTAGAKGATGGVVVDLAVGFSLVVVVVPTGERHVTDLEGRVDSVHLCSKLVSIGMKSTMTKHVSPSQSNSGYLQLPFAWLSYAMKPY